MQRSEPARRRAPDVRWGDVTPFAVCPRWLYMSAVSDRAVRLYLVLAGYAGLPDEDVRFRGKKTLAADCGCSKPTVDKAVAELVAAGAVTIVENTTEEGGRAANSYRVHASPKRAVAEEGGSSGLDGEGQAGLTASKERDLAVEKAVTTDVVTAGATKRWTVDRKLVNAYEEQMAEDVLASWNAATGQSLASKDWLAKIVMRLREHPDLSLAHHREIIDAALADPWWKGPPTPSVVYGSGAQFERSMVAARAGDRVDDAFDIAARAVQEERAR